MGLATLASLTAQFSQITLSESGDMPTKDAEIIQTIVAYFEKEEGGREFIQEVQKVWDPIKKSNYVIKGFFHAKQALQKEPTLSPLGVMVKLVGQFNVGRISIATTETKIPERMVRIIEGVLKHFEQLPVSLEDAQGTLVVKEKTGFRLRGIFRLPWGKK